MVEGYIVKVMCFAVRLMFGYIILEVILFRYSRNPVFTEKTIAITRIITSFIFYTSWPSAFINSQLAYWIYQLTIV